jgi:hypothetical protein
MPDIDNPRIREQFLRQTKELAAVTSHIEFLKLLQQMEDIRDPREREEFGRTITVDRLAQLGVPTPPGLRLSLRWFEDPRSEVIQMRSLQSAAEAAAARPGGAAAAAADRRRPQDLVEGELPTGPAGPEGPPTVCASIGFILCFSVGRIMVPDPDWPGPLSVEPGPTVSPP